MTAEHFRTQSYLRNRWDELGQELAFASEDRDSLLDMMNCPCNYVPHLYEYVDMGDVAALIAPRPLLVETGTKDYLNGPRGMENVEEQMRIIQAAYTTHDVSANLSHDVFEGEHCWHGVKSIPWMQQHLQNL